MLFFPLSWTAAVLFAAVVAEPSTVDPVQDLRAALLQPLGPGGPEARKADLQKRLDALDSLGRLAEAMGLDCWRNEPSLRVRTREDALAEEKAIEVTQEIHDLLLKKFADRVSTALSAEDSGVRAAALTLLGTTAAAERKRRENGPSNYRALPPGQGPLAADPIAQMAPDIVKRTKDDDPAVRRAAACALVEVRAEGKVAADAFGDMMSGAEKDPSVRRAAAASLEALLAARAEEEGQSLGRYLETQVQLLRLANQAVPMAVHGLDDDDLEVQVRCLAVLRRAATAWEILIGNGAGRDAVFPPDVPKPPVPPEAAEIKKLLQSLPDAVNKALPAMNRALGDRPDAAVGAANALEAVVAVRRLLMKEAAADPLPALLDARKALAKNLSHKDLHVRLAAVYVLEGLGLEAAPVSGELAKRLAGDDKDADAYVRWGAARALGKMAPAGADDAVPALAKALEDISDDVRLTAALALARFGPAANAAVPALAAAVKRDDGARLEALKALIVVGKAAAPAADAAATALADTEAEVRTAAADALARMGPLDKGVQEALRKALGDPDDDVRRAAAAALLSGK